MPKTNLRLPPPKIDHLQSFMKGAIDKQALSKATGKSASSISSFLCRPSENWTLKNIYTYACGAGIKPDELVDMIRYDYAYQFNKKWSGA